MSTPHSVRMYGLTTCIHCRHTREFLETNQVNCHYTYVDLTEGEERAEVLKELGQYNPRLSFPTLVIDGGERIIIGFRPEDIAEALDL